MAALSVDRAKVGKATRRPRRWASAAKRARSSRLAATPPVMRMRVAPRDSAAAKVFFIRSPTTACWKLAMRSRTGCGQSARAASLVLGGVGGRALYCDSEALGSQFRIFGGKSRAARARAAGRRVGRATDRRTAGGRPENEKRNRGARFARGAVRAAL